MSESILSHTINECYLNVAEVTSHLSEGGRSYVRLCVLYSSSESAPAAPVQPT